jgi:hypothetical protein
MGGTAGMGSVAREGAAIKITTKKTIRDIDLRTMAFSIQ